MEVRTNVNVSYRHWMLLYFFYFAAVLEKNTFLFLLTPPGLISNVHSNRHCAACEHVTFRGFDHQFCHSMSF
jgi:hypothetical protein